MNNLTFFLWLIAVLVGALIPVQALLTGRLAKSVGGIPVASLILFGVGFCVMLGFVLMRRESFPPWQSVAHAPLYSYAGGIIIAGYVLAINYLAPRIGVGKAVMGVIAGQIMSAVLRDHLGWLSSPITPFSWRRSAGIILLIAGILLARR